MLHDIINEQGTSIDVRVDILEKMNIFHMFSYKFLASCALIIEIIVIADNKPMEVCYRCYKSTFSHIS